jgi:tripartite-type tricarboxylate transporter receptor subunit TctC
MKIPRRQFLHLAVGAAALPFAPHAARAQAYPTRPVRWIVGYPAGGPTDIFARLIGQWLSERLGQPFVIENRPGAASNIATEAGVRAPPDGYTLLHVGTTATVNATLYENLGFNVVRDVEPIAGIVSFASIVLVNPTVPANSIPEFIAYAKANPGKINMGSPGIGSPPHIAGELFRAMTGLNLVHVPYRGEASALTDLVSGQVQFYFGASPSISYVRAGKLRALAVTTSTRWEGLPDVPAVSEFLPGYEAISWFGIGAPRNTPSEIIRRLNTEVNAGLADPKIKARLADLGGTPLVGSPADFGKLIADETEKWGKVIRAANIKPE